MRKLIDIALLTLALLAAGSIGDTVQASNVTLILNFPSFSPNGDGVKDSFTATMDVSADVDSLVATLEDTSGTITYDTLFYRSPVPQGEYSAVCAGLDSLGALLPEGTYRLKLYESTSGTPETQYRTVIIDLTPPSIWIDRIEPGTFSPGYPDASASVTFYFGVSGFEEGSETFLKITSPDETQEVLGIDITGDGYHSYQWAPETGAENGQYGVLLEITDDAGNTASDEGGLYIDSDGPEIAVSTVFPVNTMQVPEHIKGWCRDASGISENSVRMVWGQKDAEGNYYESDDLPPDSTWWSGDSLFWRFDTPDTVNGRVSSFENDYQLKISCEDSYSQSSRLVLSFTLDRTPPSPPYINLAQSKVIETPIELDISFGSDADSLFLYREHGGVTTSRRIAHYMPPTVDLEVGDNHVWAKAKDKAGNVSESSNVVTVTYDVSVGVSYPECFRSPGIFQVITDETAERVKIDIFDLAGGLVRKLSMWGPATKFEMEWNLLNDDGDAVRNGAYLMVMTIKYPDRQTVEKKFIAVVR